MQEASTSQNREHIVARRSFSFFFFYLDYFSDARAFV